MDIFFDLLSGIIIPFTFAVSYIAGNASFLKPLSKEDELKYLMQFEEGDEVAKNILVERNLRLVAHIVKKYGNIGCETDDLISIGTIGLIKGISTFKRCKGTRLATYVARCIENEILMTIRSNKKLLSEVSIQEPIGIDKEGNEISLLDLLGTKSDKVLEEVELKMQIKKLYHKMLNVLKKRERIVLQLRYGICNTGCMTQREIAKILGISRSYVSRIEKRAINKLSKSFDNNE
ncbi:MAG: RNA polymerase sporulation sigma factor SigK [Alkaliphilus sp.]|nr:RNA polymerase sporulation sigma factor SigK [bacterium AH-315-E09]PHS35467.1 MAG: RNA polymerase sporulation sigma factor SigK [Alkaliphilus sp.]